MKIIHISQLMPEEKLLERLLQGYVNARRHPYLPLTIYNYSPMAQFENVWDEVTSYTRGLIVDDHGWIVARPFKKFFNLNTSFREETLEANLPDEIPEVYDKMDGSLGILWQYAGERGVASRGSFTSTQAKWATMWLRLYKPAINWHSAITPLVEIIFKTNQIVVDYGDFEGLVLLGAVWQETGESVNYETLTDFAKHLGMTVVKRFNKTVAECIADQDTNREGYILHYREADLRLKVKFTEYLRLHRLLTGFSPRMIWEMLMKGENPISLCINVPDSFVSWLKHWTDRIQSDYDIRLRFAHIIYDTVPKRERKLQAEYILGFPEIKALVFNLLDNQGILSPKGQEMLWKMCRPKVEPSDVFRKETGDV